MIYSINDLLKITNPCVLFSGDGSKLKEEYHSLSFKYHPDKCSDTNAADAFKHLTELYKQAQILIKEGKWLLPGMIELTDKTNIKYRIKYIKKHIFELGEMYISDSIIVYVIDNKYKLLYDNYIKVVSNFKYSSDSMKQEFARYLPSIKATFETSDKCVLVLNKTSDLLLLKDVIVYYDNKGYPPQWDKHVAWVMSRLQNILCYLEYNSLVNHGICVDTVFVSMEHHSVCLLGGWWYATRVGEKMISVPKKLYNNIPPTVLASKKASYITDGEFVKALGRETIRKSKAPKAFENWLKFSASGNPVEDFKQWMEKVLPASYGERKFIKIDLDRSEIYSEE